MDKMEILNSLQRIVRDVLDREDIMLSYDMTTEYVDGWDSLVHAQIIFSVQEELGIKFSAKEMISWDTIGDMCDTIYAKTNNI